MTLTLPKTFLAPNLRHLKLLGVNLSSELPLPSSTDSLVTLTLENIQDFLPKHLITRLRSFRQLEELSIDFSNPLLHSSAERELLDTLETPVTLLKLKRFTFRGFSAYLEGLIAQIRAPHLEQLNITLFDQVAFAIPHLDSVAVVMDHRRLQLGNQPPRFDRQIDYAAQICSALMPTLSGAEELALLVRRRYWWHSGDTDSLSAKWHKLLRAFIGAKTLHICPDDVGLDPRFLPSLQELVPDISKGYTNGSFTPFIHTRQIAGRPVYLSDCLLLSPVHARRFDLRMEALRVPQLSWRPYRLTFSRSRTVDRSCIRDYLRESVSQVPPVQSRRYLPVPYLPLVQVEQDSPPPFRTARPVRGAVKTQPPPPKHIRSRIHPAHNGARSAWR
ncbi:hypothetical protein EDB92DRAFT_1844909 [Lactarius akahatsu]|uniref:Uncharacterized protein n=1 Tax=Lactarius akahatsu TaxID=416441 RepID=A0AAD4LPE6_9AGAM|nr:hypothetical protein EDB92DRAFT_1844909 [Lactarius akahatsu]